MRAAVLVSIFALSTLVAHGQEQPDLSDPETLQKILGEAVLKDTLKMRGPVGEKLFYASDSETPYTGWIKKFHDNGKVAVLGMLKGGKPEGLWIFWDEDGQKEEETRYRGGVRMAD